MRSNFCEDSMNSDAISLFHEKEMQKVGLPKWMTDLTCPFCHKELPLRAIRSVGLKTNTRNFGDIVIELFCEFCGQMDSLYFRDIAFNIESFMACLTSDKLDADPILEEVMYGMQYNNIVDHMLVSQGGLKKESQDVDD